ncbi:LytTR family DNA-binding domain-containing protein [Agriterribacter sp.]|uniref:LytR/AlgR family response regulator transcription factor n=1 Tax=Agriterribacter sp. TaxID=2821509 RepID=UPI002C775E30|nr:LytTR family DNA-binding domain-containing protein [Agriterribacter sp.]HRO44937.1 LytTR family DNA-binding domain-containing protein [Agriterribacter sp.]HRQ15675.1 LytTR family DNA-binding domain-containing protein [Agriterribacter sp.]
MKVIIIEDEKPAAQKLHKAILQCNGNIEVSAILSSTKAAVEWLRENGLPELIFLDIELSDGLSFGIFDKINITCPVIFTTAYDEYWQEAFEHNGIDYLLKPIHQHKLETALKKYETLKNYFTLSYEKLIRWQPESNEYKKRFLVKRGSDYISIRTEDISCFYAMHKLVCLVDNKNQKFILDQSLAGIEKRLDPSRFYRVNRKYLVNMTAIKLLKAYPKGKIKLEVAPAVNEDIIIPQENVAAFKEWIGR